MNINWSPTVPDNVLGSRNTKEYEQVAWASVNQNTYKLMIQCDKGAK